MDRSEQVEHLYQRLACLEDLHDEIESLASIRNLLSERVNTFLDRLSSCRQERQRLMNELEHFGDCDSVSSDSFGRDALITQLLDEASGLKQGVDQLNASMKVLSFETSSLDESINEVEVEIESLNQAGFLRTNPRRGH